MDDSGNYCRGTKSPEYKVIQGHFYHLVSLFEVSLPQLASRFFSEDFISSSEFDNALSTQPSFERTAAILRGIQRRIEYDPLKWYRTLIKVMVEFSHLDDITKDIESAHQKEKGSCLPDFFPKELSAAPEETHRQRSFSDSSVILKSKSSSSTYSENDSAFLEGDYSSTLAAGSEFIEQASGSDSRQSTGVLGEPVSSSYLMAPQGGVTWELPFVVPVNDTSPPHSSNLVGRSAMGNGREQSTDEIVVPSSLNSRVESGNESDTWHYRCQMEIANLTKDRKQLEAEVECLKSQQSLRESDLLQQKEEVCERLREQDKVVKDKDIIIQNLKENQATKDELILRLRREKADIEARICVLKKECDEAVKSKKKAEERAAAVEKEFKEKEQFLTKELETVKEREEQALLERHSIHRQLAEAMLAKEKEMNNLKERNHELEKIQIELKSEMEKHDLTRAKELAEKETQLAKTETQLAKTETQLAKTERGLAESEKKCMKMELDEMKKKLQEFEFREKP